MSNGLRDLDARLFDQLDRLGADGLSDTEIEAEAQRAKAIVDVADQIVASQKLKLDAAKLYAPHGQHVLPMLPQIGKGDDDEG